MKGTEHNPRVGTLSPFGKGDRAGSSWETRKGTRAEHKGDKKGDTPKGDTP